MKNPYFHLLREDSSELLKGGLVDTSKKFFTIVLLLRNLPFPVKLVQQIKNHPIPQTLIVDRLMALLDERLATTGRLLANISVSYVSFF
ncbi:unnamed protein product [Haemonchus placei]|uniref:Transposase n=1 Tax=Haemonchus placei TaxID=6290 RepID=A0A0N4WS34_HAEPC|nr:unnamed protein product [Haemonchus placei]